MVSIIHDPFVNSNLKVGARVGTSRIQVDLRLGFYVFGISRARRMGTDRVLIHAKFFDILPSPPSLHGS